MNLCDKNHLYLNVSKTKELCIDFRKNQRCPKPVYIKETVERVDTYKYVGVVFENINSVLKKRELENVLHEKAEIIWSKFRYASNFSFFYNAVICSIIMFGSVCWGGNISKLDRGRLEKIVLKKQVMLWGSHWTVLRFTRKETVQKTNANIKLPYTPKETLL